MIEEGALLLVSSFLFLTPRRNLIDVFFTVLTNGVVFKLVSGLGMDKAKVVYRGKISKRIE